MPKEKRAYADECGISTERREIKKGDSQLRVAHLPNARQQQLTVLLSLSYNA